MCNKMEVRRRAKAESIKQSVLLLGQTIELLLVTGIWDREANSGSVLEELGELAYKCNGVTMLNCMWCTT